jgi:hypothetical protein
MQWASAGANATRILASHPGEAPGSLTVNLIAFSQSASSTRLKDARPLSRYRVPAR